jgi:hypothetical protein
MPDLIPTIIPNVEATNTNFDSRIEKIPNGETNPLPIYNPATTKENDNTRTEIADDSSNIRIVNKTKEPEVLHGVDSKADTITTIADKEEEEFIKEVIKEHQSLNGSQ